LALWALLVFAVLLVGCGDGPITLPPGEGVDPATLDLEDDALAAQSLLAYARLNDYANSWTSLGPEGGYAGHPNHASRLVTYLDPVAAEWLEGASKDGAGDPAAIPEGALILQEGYSSEGEFQDIWMMLHREGYDLTGREWFWANLSPEGKVRASGKPEQCWFCHFSMRSNEMVFSFPVPGVVPLRGEGEGESEGTEAAVEISQADRRVAEELWRSLEEADYREEWTTGLKDPGYAAVRDARSVHSESLALYLNDAAADCLEATPETMPDGAVLLLEHLDEQGNAQALDVMWKRKGYDPENGDWFWAEFAVDGRLEKAGAGAGCRDCHQAALTNDYLFRYPVAIVHL